MSDPTPCTQVTPAGTAPPASCMAVLDGRTLFLGSAMGDSLLVRAEPAGAAEAPSEDLGAEDDGAAGSGTGVGGRADGQPTDGARAAAVADEDEGEALLLYGAALGDDSGRIGAAAEPGRYSLSVLDALASTGPIRDLACGGTSRPLGCPLLCLRGGWAGGKGGPKTALGLRGWTALFSSSAPGATRTRTSPPLSPPTGAEGEPPSLVACCGAQRTGALYALRQTLLPSLITKVPLPGPGRGHGWAPWGSSCRSRGRTAGTGPDTSRPRAPAAAPVEAGQGGAWPRTSRPRLAHAPSHAALTLPAPPCPTLQAYSASGRWAGRGRTRPRRPTSARTVPTTRTWS